MVGGCLAARWEVWESWGAEPWVVQVLNVGYQVPFVSRPPLSPVPLPLPSNSPTSVRGLALSAAVTDLHTKDAIESASLEPGFYSRLFVTPKVTGGWRPVIDLSRLNHFVRLSPFRMEASLSVLQSLCPGDWMVSIELQDSYLQVPVHPIPEVLCWSSNISIPGSLFWAFHRSVSVHPRHGPDLLHYASLWLSDPPLLERLARPGVLFPGDHAGERLPLVALPGVGSSCESLQELPRPDSDSRLSGHDSADESFEGFPDSGADPEGALSRRRVLLLSSAASRILALSSGSHVLHDSVHSRSQALYAVVTAQSQCCRSTGLSGRAGVLGRLLPPGSLLVVCCRSSRGRSSPRPSSPGSSPLHRRVRLGLGCVTRGRPSLWLMDSSGIDLFDQSPRALGSSPISPSARESVGCSVLRQYHRPVVPAQGGWYPFFQPQRCGSGHSSPVRGTCCASAPPVYSGPPQRPHGFSQSELSGSGLRMDPLPGGLQRSIPSVAGHHRPFCDLPQPSASRLLLSDGGSEGGRDRCYASALESSPGLCVPSLWPHSSSSVQGPSLPRPGGDVGGSVLATQTLVSRYSGVAGGGSNPPAYAEGSTQTTPFSSLPSEPPRASVDWLSY